jgi:Xaa-Pro aminopeptidase
MPDYKARVAKAQAQMREQGVDLLFLRPSPDLAYLTGFRMVPFSSAMMYDEMWLPESWLFGTWIFQEGDPIVTVPARFHKAIGEFILPQDVRIAQDHAEAGKLVRKILAEGKTIRNIGIAKETQAQWAEAVRNVLPDVRFSISWECTKRLRQVKDQEELALMRKAGEITDQVFAAVLAKLQPGMSEMEIIAEVDYQFLLHGAEGTCFTTGVSIGNKGSLRPEGLALPKKVIEQGDHLSFDLGIVYEGYCTDFGRTVSFGEPSPELRRAFDTVYEMQMNTFRLLSEPGHAADEIDASAREICRARGYSGRVDTIGLPSPPPDSRDDELEKNGRFYHGLGHSIGLEVHEYPFMQYTTQEPLVPNMVLTPEPSLIKPGTFACRIEDNILITRTGAEWLEKHPRHLLVIE